MRFVCLAYDTAVAGSWEFKRTEQLAWIAECTWVKDEAYYPAEDSHDDKEAVSGGEAYPAILLDNSSS